MTLSLSCLVTIEGLEVQNVSFIRQTQIQIKLCAKASSMCFKNATDTWWKKKQETHEKISIQVKRTSRK